MSDLDFDSLQILEKFYFKLENVLKKENAFPKNKPIIFTLLGFSQTRTLKIINESSINGAAFVKSRSFNYLLEESFLKQLDDKNKLDAFTLTAKGVWLMDKEKKVSSENDLLDYIDFKLFSSRNSNRNLSEKNIIILIVMIGMRFFSADIPMDLNDFAKLDKWTSLFQKTILFCEKNKIINKEVRLDSKGVEHPVTYLLRRAQDLPEMTNYLFNFSGVKTKQYFLDITGPNIENRKSATLKLRHIFRKILHKREISDDFINQFLCFLNNLAHEESIFFLSKFDYITYEWDDIIADSLLGI